MLLHFLGWLYAFVLTAIFSAGVALAPITVAWNSIWVYVTFALCLIPGYLVAWLSVMLVFGLLALFGVGVAAGAIGLSEAASKKKRKSREELLRARFN